MYLSWPICSWPLLGTLSSPLTAKTAAAINNVQTLNCSSGQPSVFIALISLLCKAKGYFISYHQQLKDRLRNKQEKIDYKQTRGREEGAQWHILANKRGAAFQKQQLWVCIPGGPILRMLHEISVIHFASFSLFFSRHHFCSSQFPLCRLWVQTNITNQIFNGSNLK